MTTTPPAGLDSTSAPDSGALVLSEREGFAGAVHRVVAATRPGEVMTYGEVAEEAGYPGAARAVGNVLARDGGDLPWWRIVASGGRLATAKVHRQADLLRAEGVEVTDGRVVLACGGAAGRTTSAWRSRLAR